MFDAVRIRSTPVTDAAGYGDAEGVIYGVTTVSVTGVEVIGAVEDDCAVNVDFDGTRPAAWFQPSLVEVIGKPETTIEVGRGVLTRVEGTDDWIEPIRPPWWEFWSRK